MKAKHWYDYLWVYAIIYFALGFFNILFAWLGMIDFLLPLLLAIFGGNKFFCNHLCGRGQLLHSAISTVRSTKVQPNAGGLVVVLMELSAESCPPRSGW